MTRYILIIGLFIISDLLISSSYIHTATYIMNNVLANLNFFRRNFSQLAEANYRIRLLISLQRFLLCIKLPAFFTQCWRKAPCTKVFTPRCVWLCEVLLTIVWRFDCHRTRTNGWHAFWLRRNYNVTLGSVFFSLSTLIFQSTVCEVDWLIHHTQSCFGSRHCIQKESK